MSVIYPSINSKGISCFPKSEHGAIAGVILFFTCLSAVVGPLAMGAISDAMGGPKYGFMLATGFAAIAVRRIADQLDLRPNPRSTAPPGCDGIRLTAKASCAP